MIDRGDLGLELFDDPTVELAVAIAEAPTVELVAVGAPTDPIPVSTRPQWTVSLRRYPPPVPCGPDAATRLLPVVLA